MEAQEIKKEIESTRLEYFAALETKPAAEALSLSAKVKKLQAELSTALSSGADVCKVCGTSPMGMEQQAALGSRTITLYEVGCRVCPKEVAGGENGTSITRARRSQGFTVSEAVENWNKEEFLPPKTETT